MPIYRAPVDDYRFLFNEVFEIARHADLPGFAELSPELVDDILNGAAKLCEDVLQPLNQSGDEEGCHFENGTVRTPKGFPGGLQGLLRRRLEWSWRTGKRRRRRASTHHYPGSQ